MWNCGSQNSTLSFFTGISAHSFFLLWESLTDSSSRLPIRKKSWYGMIWWWEEKEHRRWTAEKKLWICGLMSCWDACVMQCFVFLLLLVSLSSFLCNELLSLGCSSFLSMRHIWRKPRRDCSFLKPRWLVICLEAMRVLQKFLISELIWLQPAELSLYRASAHFYPISSCKMC